MGAGDVQKFQQAYEKVEELEQKLIEKPVLMRSGFLFFEASGWRYGNHQVNS